MKEMSREEKKQKLIKIMIDDWSNYEKSNNELAERILDAIEPPETKAGMIGKAWTIYGNGHIEFIHGILSEIDKNNTNLPYQIGFHWYKFFIPMTPEEIKKELEEMIK